MWTVKDLKEWCNFRNGGDEDIVRVYTLDEFGDEVFVDEDFLVTTRKPRRTDFTHSECGYCEETCFNGVKRLYCNYWEDIILKRDIYSCENFEHKEKFINYAQDGDDLSY